MVRDRERRRMEGGGKMRENIKPRQCQREEEPERIGSSRTPWHREGLVRDGHGLETRNQRRSGESVRRQQTKKILNYQELQNTRIKQRKLSKKAIYNSNERSTASHNKYAHSP